jgi:MFS family permease
MESSGVVIGASLALSGGGVKVYARAMESPPLESESAGAEPAESDRPTTTGPIRAYTAAQCISAVGSWMQKTAVGWLAWDLTHSVAWVGALALMDLISILWVAPLAGTVADRRSPYRLYLITQTCSVLIALTLCALDLTGALTIGLLLGITLIESTVNGFNSPVRMTTINFLTPTGGLSRAIAMNSVGIAVARSFGPATAGVLLASGGAATVFALNSVSYLAMMGVLWRLKHFVDRAPAAGRGPFLNDITGGFAYVARTPDIALIISVAVVFAVLARPFAELLPAFAGDVFAGGPQTLGLLLTIQGLGAMAGALFMMRRKSPKPLKPLMFMTGISMCVCLIVFCATRDLKIALPALFAVGVFHVLCNIILQTLAQERADPAFRGRVLSLYSLIFRTGPSIGAFLIGVTAPLLGLQLLIGAVAAAAAVLLLWLRSRPA